MLSALPLAATGEAAKSGPLGLAVILIFCVACYFLFKSMSKHLRKVREEFPVDRDDDAPDAASGDDTTTDSVDPAPQAPAAEASDEPAAESPSAEQESPTERPTS